MSSRKVFAKKLFLGTSSEAWFLLGGSDPVEKQMVLLYAGVLYVGHFLGDPRAARGTVASKGISKLKRLSVPFAGGGGGPFPLRAIGSLYGGIRSPMFVTCLVVS